MDTSKDTKQPAPAAAPAAAAAPPGGGDARGSALWEKALQNLSPEERQRFQNGWMGIMGEAQKVKAQLTEAQKREEELKQREQRLRAVDEGKTRMFTGMIRELLASRRQPVSAEMEAELQEAEKDPGVHRFLASPAMQEVGAALREGMRGPVHQPAAPAAAPGALTPEDQEWARSMQAMFGGSPGKEFEALPGFGTGEVKASGIPGDPNAMAAWYWSRALDNATDVGVPGDYIHNRDARVKYGLEDDTASSLSTGDSRKRQRL